MADLSVALTWLAISAASAKGLSVFARAAATKDSDDESTTTLACDDRSAHEGSYPIDAHLLI
jgi:hypothetical protein